MEPAATEASGSLPLPRRPLGRTGLQVSVLGFGGSPLGSVFAPIDEEEGVRAVLEAFKRGINYFDVSPFYGGTRAEQVLGRAIKQLPRQHVVLSTKVGRYGEDTFDFSAVRVTRSIQESCERLNTEYIDIAICHDVEFVNLQQIVDETLPALKKLKEEGKVRFIGISGLPLKAFQWILTHCAPGAVDVVLSYCHYCLIDDSLLSLLPLLEEKGVGIINASPLSMGLLAPQGPPQWHPAPQGLKDACERAVAHCKAQGVDLPALALRFSTANPDISTTLVGMCTTAQVVKNIEAILSPPSAEEQRASSDLHALLSESKNTTWPSGLPESN